MKKRGRPPSQKPKNRRINIRVTEQQLKEINKLAKQLSLSKTELFLEGVKLLRKYKKNTSPTTDQSLGQHVSKK